MNSRYELKQQDNKFCGDISTLFQSHCQTRISYLQTCYHTIYKETGRDGVLETLRVAILFTNLLVLVATVPT